MQSYIQDVNTFPNAAVCRRHETFNVTFQQCPLEIYQHYSLTTSHQYGSLTHGYSVSAYY